MPKLTKVNISGYFSYGVNNLVKLDNQGLVLLNGINHDRNLTSNGSGKSSLINAICQILYGENPSGENSGNVINTFVGRALGYVEFLDDANTTWRVIDIKKWKKTDKYPDDYLSEPSEILLSGQKYSGTDVHLEKWDGVKWVDERNTNNHAGAYRLDLKSTRKKIIDILRLDYKQFMTVCYMEQQQSLRFVKGTHKEKIEILSNLANISVWDSRIAAIREDITALEQKRAFVENEISSIQRYGSTEAPNPEHLQNLLQTEADSILKISEIDHQIDLNQTQVAEFESKIAGINTTIDTKRQEIRSMTASKQMYLKAAGDVVNEYRIATDKVRNRPTDVTIINLEQFISQQRGLAQARRYDLSQLLTGAGKCPRCRTNVSANHILRQRELLQTEINEIENKVEESEAVLREKSDAWQQYIVSELDILTNDFESKKSEIDALVQNIDTSVHLLESEIDSLRSSISTLGDSPKSHLGVLEQKRLVVLLERTRAADGIAAWRTQQKKHDDAKETLERAFAAVRQIDTDITYRRALDKMFGNKGIKAWKLNNILTDLNATVKEYIDILSGGNTNVNITQYREKSDGDLTADIQILISDGAKHGVPFALYSGGERQHIMLALIGAFWQLSSRHNSGMNVLFLDEVLGPLDDINAQPVFEFINYIRSKGKNTMILTTHSQVIKDQIRFNKEWVVEKTNDISKIITGE